MNILNKKLSSSFIKINTVNNIKRLNSHFQKRLFSRSKQMKTFQNEKIKLPREVIRQTETAEERYNKSFPRISLIENNPSTENMVMRNLINKNKVYPKQHPFNIDNEDFNIISYKPKPIGLVEDFHIPRELYIHQPIEFKSPDNAKSLDIAIIGPANSGKSSLFNKLIDSNVSMVSPKFNTTSEAIEGITTDFDSKVQLNIIDTPGAFRANKNSLYASNILTRAWTVLSDIDKVVFVVDSVKKVDRVVKLAINRFFKLSSDYKSRKLSEKLKEEGDNFTVEKIIELSNQIDEEIKMSFKEEDYQNITSMTHSIPAVLVMNKIDLASNKRKLKHKREELESLGKFDKVFYVSCETGYGVKELKEYLQSQSMRRVWKHHPSFKSTLSEVKKLENALKQNIFMRTFKEVPYESDVTLKSWVPLSNGELSLVFQVEVRNKNHRAMILGRDSINIKEITANTIRDISEMIQRPVKVEILVVLTKIKNIHKSNNRQALEF